MSRTIPRASRQPGGHDWENISHDLNELTIDDWAFSMRVHPVERNKLYVGTDRAGILVLDQSLTDIEREPGADSNQIGQLEVLQDFPNPFNPLTTIDVTIPEDAATAKISLRIYHGRGRLVRTLADEVLSAGRHRLAWDGSDERGDMVPSGVYLYTVRRGTWAFTRKMTIVG